MGNLIHTSGLFFASGHNSKRVTIPDITVDSASSIRSIQLSNDAPPVPLLNHLQLQPGMQEASRNSYMSVISHLSDFVAGINAPVAQQQEPHECLSRMASSVCLPQTDRSFRDSKLSMLQGNCTLNENLNNQKNTPIAFHTHMFKPLKALFGFSVKFLANAIKPIHQALMDKVQAFENYKKHGVTQVNEHVSNNSLNKRNNLNFSCGGGELISSKSNGKPFEFKLLELNLSSQDLSHLFNSGDNAIIP